MTVRKDRIPRDPTLYYSTKHLADREEERTLSRSEVCRCIKKGEVEVIENGSTAKFRLDRRVDTMTVVVALDERVVMTTYREDKD